MSEFALVYPMLAMVALTTSVLVILFLGRVRAVREGASHTVIHLGKNAVRTRIAAYFGGWLALLGMWIHLAVCVTRRG